MTPSLLLALALTNIAHPPVPIPPPVAVEVTGKVREVGSGPGGKVEPILELDDKSEVTLHGREDADDIELRRLAGTRVKVSGMKGDPTLPRGNHVRVLKYEILDAGGGVVPKLGRIAEIAIDGKTRLLFVDDEGKAAFLPQGWIAKLQKHVGAKVWIVAGETKGSEMTPSKFAILRPGPKSGSDAGGD
jgi:hypothetical protein